ncbi:MAG: hypothetical protein UY12_C0039G0006 [Parcubacteria group bacterium GW2011_GWA2_47_8b]|nr:MAG: hypothetical protein UY12_C0039G0006 [Parcubacteria group bacterium GW2011_GWA2_47_8b]
MRRTPFVKSPREPESAPCLPAGRGKRGIFGRGVQAKKDLKIIFAAFRECGIE